MIPRFRRLPGQRRYKRMFVIVAEGTVTEPEYFSLLNQDLIVQVKCLKSKSHLPPEAALKTVREYIQKESLLKTDEVWVVVDKDSWREDHLTKLHNWAQSRTNYGFALSNPKFEYWLLLHFEDAKGVATGDDCDSRLAGYLPGYDKHIDPRHFTLERIRDAAEKAKKRDQPPCTDWPRKPGTTVYKLVEKILASGKEALAPMQSPR
jgi:hypothetical protein